MYLAFYFYFLFYMYSSIYSKPENYHIRSKWPSYNHPGHSLSLSEDACNFWGSFCCCHECILQKTSKVAEHCGCVGLWKEKRCSVVKEIKHLCPLTPMCVELPGKQSSCSSVSGVFATKSNGRIQQNCILLWRRRQSHQHRGLLWYLCWIYEQVWGEKKLFCRSFILMINVFLNYSLNCMHVILYSSSSIFPKLMVPKPYLFLQTACDE